MFKKLLVLTIILILLASPVYALSYEFTLNPKVIYTNIDEIENIVITNIHPYDIPIQITSGTGIVLNNVSVIAVFGSQELPGLTEISFYATEKGYHEIFFESEDTLLKVNVNVEKTNYLAYSIIILIILSILVFVYHKVKKR